MASQVNSVKRIVAYFSMEIALENAMPSYSGGLGVLAGDTIRAAADLRLPMVAVSLLYRKGFFTQRLAEDGSQTEEPVEWRVEDFLKEETARASVSIENRHVELPKPTATSPALCMAVIPTTACVRKSFWESAACACSARSATTTSRGTT
jgi:glucan phosphorylase